LHDPTFSRFDTIPEFDTTTAYTAIYIASRGKNRPYCTVKYNYRATSVGR